VFFLFVAVVATVVIAGAVVAASGVSVIGSAASVATLVASCAAAAALLMYRSRMVAVLALVFAVLLAVHGSVMPSLTPSVETVAVVGIIISGLASHYRTSVDPIAASAVLAVVAALVGGQASSLTDWKSAVVTVSTPAAVALAVMESQRVWSGGFVGVVNIVALALPAIAKVTGIAVPALGLSSCTISYAGKVAAAAALALHVAGVRRLVAPSAATMASPRAGPSKSLIRWVPVVLALAAAASAPALRAPLLLAAALLALLAHFASRSAPLLAPLDTDARASAVFAASVFLLARSSALDQSSAGFAVAVAFAAATSAWAVMQVLLERDGPFFSNGVRSMFVDLVAIATVIAAGIVVLALYSDVAGLPGVAQATGLVTTAWAAASGAVATASSWLPAVVAAPRLSAPTASVLAVILIVGADLLRAAIQRSSVPLPAHLSGEVLMSGKGMRPSFTITVDGVGGTRSGMVAILASSWKSGEPSFIEVWEAVSDAADDSDTPADQTVAGAVVEDDEDDEYDAAEDDEDDDALDMERSPVTVFATPAEAASGSSGMETAASCCEVGLLIPSYLADGATEESMLRAKAQIEAASGRPCRWARTADGSTDCGVIRAVSGAGMTLVLWSSWPRDDVHADNTGQHVADETAGFGKAASGRGAIVRIVSPPASSDEMPTDEVIAFASRAHAAYTRFSTQGMGLEALAEVVPHRGFELEA